MPRESRPSSRMSGDRSEGKSPVRVTFLPEGKSVEVPEGATLLEAANLAGVSLLSVCGGEGVCGRCRVLVRSGRVEAKPTLFLAPSDVRAGYALACQARVYTDAVVEVPVESRAERALVVDLEAQGFRAPEAEVPRPYSFSPLVRKLFLSLPPPTLEDNAGDQERVFRAIHRVTVAPILQAGLKVLQSMPALLRSARWQVTATLAQRGGTTELLQLEPGDRSREAFGVAVDVGTSTVVAHLLHLPTGKTLDAEARYNSQRGFGAEVTRRILAAERLGVEKLQALVVSDINDLVSLMVERQRVKLSDVLAVLCAGNTAMTHLLLGLPPGALRKHPYVAAALAPPPVRAAEVGIRINPRGLLYVVPGIGGWVGGDITAGLLASGVHRSDELILFVDIGTNGEVVLGCKDWLVACSTSAGPAFEGAGVSCGMRASPGAIHRVESTPQGLICHTIGGSPPQGLCGSGLIDAVAELFRLGYVDRAGKLQPRDGRVVERNGDLAFLLVPKGPASRDIFITQRDIANVLRAKAAIYAGISVLLKETGVDLTEVSWLYIAGAFGSHLDPHNALTLGLIPDFPLERVRFLGNTSLAGAKLCLLSQEAFEEAHRLAASVTYYDLASCPYYYEEFLAALFLPHTELSRFPSVAAELAAEGKP